MSVRKTPTEFIQKLFLFACCKSLLSEQYYLKNLTNKRTSNRIVDKTFKEIDSFPKLLIIFEIFKLVIRSSHSNWIFQFFFKVS